MGARVLPASQSSWYSMRLPCRRPAARALFSSMQYVLRAYVRLMSTRGRERVYTFANMVTHAIAKNETTIVCPRIYFGAWSVVYTKVAMKPLCFLSQVGSRKKCNPVHRTLCWIKPVVERWPSTSCSGLLCCWAEWRECMVHMGSYHRAHSQYAGIH